MPRSRLSRRIGLLEERLGVRLIQRSTRRFAVKLNQRLVQLNFNLMAWTDG
jgi:DNA-binding transcriptional LysR family regulator